MTELRSATAVPEKELVRWAFEHPGLVERCAPWLLRGETHIAEFEVGAPVLTSGDRKSDELDVLLWPICDPSMAIAIEAKRVRVDAATLLTEQPGGLPSVAKGVEQSRARVREGFHAVYIAVFVEVDARGFSGGYWQGGMLPPPLLRLIRQAIYSSAQDPDIGLLVFQATQPVEKDVLLGGSFGLIDSRRATARRQDASLTDRVAGLASLESRPNRVIVHCVFSPLTEHSDSTT